MTKRKGKPVSFDAMVKFFMQQYNIPTRKDVEKMLIKLDRLEMLVKKLSISSKKASRKGRGRKAKTASNTVIDILKQYKNGADFAKLQARSKFNEKKLRNIIFRLHKIGKIERKNRGIYIVSN